MKAPSPKPMPITQLPNRLPPNPETDMEMHGWKPGKMEVNPGRKADESK